MRVKSIVSKDPGGNDIINYQYNYDRMDNILNKDTEHGDYDYGYDDFYRLTSSSRDLITGTSLDEGFTYDKVGNRVTSADTTGNWAYNQNNELQTLPPSSSGLTGETGFVYDDNGNMISKTDQTGTMTYIYDIENRLVQVSISQLQSPISYYYDPFGRRLWKDVDGARTYFLYADEGLVAELDETGTETKTYGYNPDSTWTTDPLFMEEDGSYYFYHNDHLGIPQKMTSVNGAVVWGVMYGAFGEVDIESISTITNNLRFPGQYYDLETGLRYNYHRYYDTQTGRYLRMDPIYLIQQEKISAPFCMEDGILEVQEQGLNKYLYVTNNVPNRIDPLGLKGCGPGSGVPEWLVPDYPSGYNFKSCCNAHDDCYGCKGKSEGMKKRDCDLKFCKCLIKKCFRANSFAQPWRPCPAIEYCIAVTAAGKKAFDNARKCCK